MQMCTPLLDSRRVFARAGVQVAGYAMAWQAGTAWLECCASCAGTQGQGWCMNAPFVSGAV